MTRRGDKIAIIQQAVDLQQAAKEIDALLSTVRDGEKVIEKTTKTVEDARYKMGLLFREVRKTIPVSGPKAKAWGEFVEARGISRDTALNYMKLVGYVDENPAAADAPVGEIYREKGIGVPAKGESFAEVGPVTSANPPPVSKPKTEPLRYTRTRDSGADCEGAQEEYGDGLEERQLDEGGERIPLFPGEPAAEALRGKPMEAPPKAPAAQAEFVWEHFRDEVVTYVEILEEQCPTFLRPDMGDLLIAEGSRLKETRP